MASEALHLFTEFAKTVWLGVVGMNASNWIAVSAMVAAWLAAWQTRRIAKRSYELSLSQELRRQPSIELYIDRGYFRRLSDPARRVFVFRIIVTNQSDASNSIKTLRLRIERQQGGAPQSNMEITADSASARPLALDVSELLVVPQQLAARAVVAGVAVFPVAENLVRDWTVDSYTVCLVDSFDRRTESEMILISEEV